MHTAINDNLKENIKNSEVDKDRDGKKDITKKLKLTYWSFGLTYEITVCEIFHLPFLLLSLALALL